MVYEVSYMKYDLMNNLCQFCNTEEIMALVWRFKAKS